MPTFAPNGSSYPGVGAALSIATETTLGTPASSGMVYLPFTSRTLGIKNKLIANKVIRRSIGQAPFGSGSVDGGGDITINTEVSTAGALIAPALGLDTVTASGSGFLHSYSLSNVNKNTYSLWADDGDGFLAAYVGSVFEGLTVTCKPDSFLELKLTAMSQTAVITSASLSPTFSNAYNYFEWNNMSNLYGGTGLSLLNNLSINVTEFSLDLKNNLKPKMGSTTDDSPVTSRRP